MKSAPIHHSSFNLQTFFEKFDQFADAPDAVAKMRELVLQLAVTGRLVAQNKQDEPASTLLDSTADERAKLVAAKKIKSRPTTRVEAEEQPFDVPSSWAWARLSDVGFELGQKVPDKRFTYIDVGGIDSKKGRISDRVEKLEPGDAPSRARKLVTQGTVIYSTVRPYLLNIAIVDQDFDPEPIASTAFGILHPFEGINNRYLFYWLRSAPFTAYVQAGMKGMAYPAINDEKFYSGPIALPPLAEQHRIVAKVDELMVLCDRLEAQQQERETQKAALARATLARFADAPTPANLERLFYPSPPCLRASVRKKENVSHRDTEAQSSASFFVSPSDLRKSILTLAIQGKLVPQDPNDEPAEELLSRILTENPRLRDSFKEPTEPANAAENLAIIPESWVPVALGRVMKVTSSKRIFESEYADTGVPFFRSKEIGDLSRGESIKTTLYISAERYAELKQHPDCPQPGDLLLTSVGTIGNTWIVDDREFYFKDGNITQIIRTDGIGMRYVQLYMASPMFMDAVERIVAGTAYNALTIVKIKTLTFPLPPLAEQKRIVAKVEQLMALVDELEAQLATSRATGEKLLTALVAELTNGKKPCSI
jgi:type I restriction enzyme S subunit